MNTTLLLQQSLNGVALGLGYALVAVGLSMVLHVMDVLNFAHGDFFMLGGLGVFAAAAVGLPYFLGTALSVLFVVVLSLLLVTVLGKLFEADHFSALLGTFAISLVISNMASLSLSGRSRAVAGGVDIPLLIGDVVLTGQRALAMVVAVVILGSAAIWLERSSTGRQIRAVAENSYGAQITGIDTRRVQRTVFVAASGIAALGGALLAPVIQVNPLAGLATLIKAFLVVVLGGVGRVPGIVIGGLLLGLAEALGGAYIGTRWTDLVGFGLLLAVFIFRPEGLFPTKRA